MKKLIKCLKAVKAVLVAVWEAVGFMYRPVLKLLKWLDKHSPIWVVYDLIAGGILSGVVYAGLSQYVGHGLSYGVAHPAAGVVITAVAPFHAWALPVALTLGIFLAGMLIILDIKTIKENGHL